MTVSSPGASRQTRSDVRSFDVRWGIRWGISFAVVYALTAIGIFVAGGALFTAAGWWMLVLVVAAYFGAGVSAGAVVGLMRRRLDSYAGVCLVSIAAGVPSWAAMNMVAMQHLPTAWDRDEWFSWATCVLVVGPIMGCSLHRKLR